MDYRVVIIPRPFKRVMLDVILYTLFGCYFLFVFSLYILFCVCCYLYKIFLRHVLNN